jgi:hypothetical protein
MMDLLQQALNRVRSLFPNAQMDNDLDEEMALAWSLPLKRTARSACRRRKLDVKRLFDSADWSRRSRNIVRHGDCQHSTSWCKTCATPASVMSCVH